MKLALIRQRYTDFGGAELYVSRLARRLVERGHEVHILAREWRADRTEGLIFHPLQCGGPAFIRLKAFARAAAREVENGDFDLVHSFERTYSQDIFRAGDGCHREWLVRRARAQGVWRGRLDTINPRHRAFLDVEARLFADPRLKIVLVNSRLGREEIIKHYHLARDKFRVVYNGLDQGRFNPGLRGGHRAEVRAELNLEADEPVALFVGSGFARKGLVGLIRALPASKVRLVVAGRDRLSPYENLARRLGVLERIIFLGPRTDAARLYGAADVFVLPSWYEPFSNACLEAMAAGLPVITNEETGAAEIIEEGVNGSTLAFPTRPEELAAKIEMALKMDRAGLIEANQRLLAPFDWEKNLADTLAAYGEALGQA